MELTVQADEANDIVYLGLSNRAFKASAVARTIRADDDIALDFDRRGRLVGVEVMNASERLVRARGSWTFDALVGVKEAAALIGVTRPNFIRDYADREGFPAPVAELGAGRIRLRAEVEAYASAQPKRTRRGAS